MTLKKQYANKLKENPELRLEMALEIGVTPLTIYRALDKNAKGESSKLTSRLGLRFLSGKFEVEESDLVKE